ncbi:hypothetical protein CJ214_00810 [Peptoniphilus lacrimalis]|nr:hypothetical protein CJ214_00810 [Peptoniphilus lacrimalis]
MIACAPSGIRTIEGFTIHHAENVKNPYDKIKLRAGAPLTLDPSRGRFGGMTSSFAIVNFPVFYYANAI